MTNRDVNRGASGDVNRGANRDADKNTNNQNTLGLYIHVPFCVSKCFYCDFLSGVASPEVQKDYFESLKKEIRGRSRDYTDYTLTSLFIGGGTPSVVPAQWITELIYMIGQCYRWDNSPEITMELNPATADEAKLKQYYLSGVNRLSIGLQSALDEDLKRLGRAHDYVEFYETYRLARETGFTNINTDIISAIPGQDLDSCRKTLRAVLALTPPPEHISAYSLIVEEGTPFWEAYREGALKLPDEETERDIYWETDRILKQHGYCRYEISNYARIGYECRHNRRYWLREEYAGFGIGAASLVKNTRFTNTDDLSAYIKEPVALGRDMQALSRQEQMEEFFFLGLRLTEGVSCGRFRDCFGQDAEEIFGDVIHRNISDGLMIRMEEYRDIRLKLTDRGLDLSNYCMARFIL
jgi:oxygen-independent coproporphyrinogen-3 oxidase